MSVWLYPNLNYLLEIKTECGQRGLSLWLGLLSHDLGPISYVHHIIQKCYNNHTCTCETKLHYTWRAHFSLYLYVSCWNTYSVYWFWLPQWGRVRIRKICIFCVKYVIMWDNWWWSSFSPPWGKYGYEVYGNTGCFAPEVMLGLGWMWMQWLFGCLTLCSKVEYSFIPWKINFVL